MIIGRYNYATYVTYIGVLCAIVAMYYAMYSNNIYISLVFLILSGICDLFDGFIARKINRDEQEKQIGIQIDSLADTVNFIVLPVVIGLQLSKPNIFVLLIFAFYTICGITRLSFFNVTVMNFTEESRPKYFTGMPVTFSALLFPIVYLIQETFLVEIYNIFAIALAFLFILRIKIPKPRGIAYALLVTLAVVMIAYFIMKGVK